MRYLRHSTPNDLFGLSQMAPRERAMENAINRVTELLEVDEKSPWSPDVKASDEVLGRIFRVFFKELKLPLIFRKSDYHELASLLKADEIDPEIVAKLDAIVEIAMVTEKEIDGTRDMH